MADFLRYLDEEQLDRLNAWLAGEGRPDGLPEAVRDQAEALAATYAAARTGPGQAMPKELEARLLKTASALALSKRNDRRGWLARWRERWGVPALCAAFTALAFIVARVLPDDIDLLPHGGSAPAATYAWAHGTDPSGAAVAGNVSWQADRNSGYMTFTGLQPNNVSSEQYQLWIIDAQRDARYPIDGGVFDVPAGASSVRVPIHAHLHVGQAAAFVVTLERAGGVVVSDRSRIVAIAKAS